MFITAFKRNELIKATKTYIVSKGISNYSNLSISELYTTFHFIKKEYIANVIFPRIKRFVSDDVAFEIFASVINSNKNIEYDKDAIEVAKIEEEIEDAEE